MAPLRIVHAIHDFLPRHRAGSEIYACELARAQSARHHVTVMTAEYDPQRPHGQVDWRVYEGLPVAEIINNWVCASFAETYRPPLIGARIASVLRATQPDVVHVHNLLNLSFELPALARAAGACVVATLHDYTLVCPSGGQRLHRAEQHICYEIETERCARCFGESPFAPQMTVGAQPRLLQRAALAAKRLAPALTARAAGVVASAATARKVSAEQIEARLAAAKQLFGEIDLSVSPSASLAGEYRKLGMPAEKIIVSDNGMAPLAGAPAPVRTSARTSPLRIGFVGTIVWHKGVHVLIEAIRGLPAGGWDLRIFGDTATFPDYVAALRSSAAGLPVTFAGPFEQARTHEIYDQIDVLVVPSIWLENSPLVIQEARQAGVPIVGARIGGIADLVRDGIDGRLYDPHAPAALTEILAGLIRDRSPLESWQRHAPPVKSSADDAMAWDERYRSVMSARRKTESRG